MCLGRLPMPAQTGDDGIRPMAPFVRVYSSQVMIDLRRGRVNVPRAVLTLAPMQAREIALPRGPRRGRPRTDRDINVAARDRASTSRASARAARSRVRG